MNVWVYTACSREYVGGKREVTKFCVLILLEQKWDLSHLFYTTVIFTLVEAIYYKPEGSGIESR
jgi:hypothetical protein